eukprot:TRINITY_DN12302_c0_g1_i3.p1 TRINITY_DN12302_c0_g1~~TRINITY_DN12302_c0_g1_i3.p1  ORF type:complete len:228 (-),score=21.51 TRINITY_DN12302_c0_g1_i3:108-710(-)
MGRGRTTTGMVIGCLISFYRDSSSGTSERPLTIDDFEWPLSHAHAPPQGQGPGGHQSLPPTAAAAPASPQPHDHVYSEQQIAMYKRGEYRWIQRLVRLLEDGVTVKAELDRIIDYCSHMQNLREAIFHQKLQSESTVSSETVRRAARERATHYLVRYFYLLCFASFLRSRSLSLCQETSFVEWMSSHTDILNCLSEPSLD